MHRPRSALSDAALLKTKAWAAFFEANKRKGAKPTSLEEMLSDNDLAKRIIDAHLIGGRLLFQWVSGRGWGTGGW